MLFLAVTDVWMSPIPSTVSQAAVRAFKHLSKPYEELALSLKNADALQSCFQTHNNVYAEDKNLGLISLVLERQEMKRIAALRDTYVAISLDDVAHKISGSKPTSSEDVQHIENLILRMVNINYLIL